MKALLKYGLVLVICAVLVEAGLRVLFWGGSFGGIFLIPYPVLTESNRAALTRLAEGKTDYLQFDPDLGWSIKPNGATKNGLYRANSAGFRADREYPVQPAEGTLRVATFGDSFTHCDDVPNESTWQSSLEKPSDRLEVLNFGVMGYGTDQALLRFRAEAERWKPRVAVMGFMVDNILRNVNRFPAFRAPDNLPLAKPRYRSAKDGLELIPGPGLEPADYLTKSDEELIKSLAPQDRVYDPHLYEPRFGDFSYLVRTIRTIDRILGAEKKPDWTGLYQDSEPVGLTVELLKAFADEAQARGIRPLVVIFPDRSALADYTGSRAKIWQTLLDQLDREGIPYLDLTKDLAEFVARQESEDDLFRPHYAPPLNARVAELLAPEIKRLAHD